MIVPPKIILITDPRYSLEHITKTIEAVASVLEPGDILVQLRDKSGARKEEAQRLCDVTHACSMSFVVNGDAELARAIGADGVHLGGARPDVASARTLLGDDAFISIAAHADDDVALAESARGTAVLVSPIFDTPDKGTPRGVAALANARAIAKTTLVYALGGIDDRRAAACSAADGVAVIRALFEAADARVTARALAAPFVRRRR